MDTFDVHKIRKDFPVLNQKVYGQPLVYFDNGATTQKPQSVIDCIVNIYSHKNASIHRSVNYLSDQMTNAYEEAREKVRAFINAGSKKEIVFTSGATASINMVAFAYGEKFVQEGDEIIVSEMEHHANIVPWQLLCERKGAHLRVIPFNDLGELDINAYKDLLNPKTKLVAVNQVSNSLGSINPVSEMLEYAHDIDVPVLIDGSQGIQHGSVDVQKLDCDFYVFSGHKIYGPTGIGVLYGKEKWLEEMPPYQSGGDMIEKVSFEKTSFNELPFKFEAGTTNYVGAIALGAALDYLTATGLEAINDYEKELLAYGSNKLENIQGLQLYGTSKNKIPIFSFLLKGIHPYDTGMVLDKLGIAVRTGTHCTMPVMDHYHIDGTLRASLCFYNTREEIDRLVDGLEKVKEMFS